ncbi:MAG TPA: type II secretion system minor pseudopilin GspK [Quisquiliibacterium sp.]|nr:type II secretion system minor pseudopilin GspK [Quisquiliibacterium sp.]
MRRATQRGVAVVTALLVVMLATTVVAGLYVRENVTVRSVENRLSLSQTRWVERAAVDWAKVILRADARGGVVDHLGEPWAVPVAETSLDETVTAGARIGDRARPATIAGLIVDAQSRFNLTAMVQGGQVSAAHLAAFRRLLSVLGQPESLADMVLSRLLRSMPRTLEGRIVPPADLALLRVDDLRTVPGFDAAVIEALRPFVVVLPEPTLVNVNTAPAEVLAALVPGLELGGARRFVARRERTFFRNLNEAAQQIDGQPVLPANLLSVGSRFFFVRGVVRFDRVEASSETLISRSSDRVDILWQQRY